MCDNPWCGCGQCHCGPGCRCQRATNLYGVQRGVYAQIRRYRDLLLPVEPNPVEPGPILPVEPWEPILPVEPGEPILPVEPEEPILPVEPEEPILPVEPVEPELCPVSDAVCRECEHVFQGLDPKATILPGIGLPSQSNGVCTITHGMPGMPNLRINGLESHSPLANNALFSAECSDGHSLNLYEVMVPDTVGATPGAISSGEAYTQRLRNEGLDVAGTHFHWWGMEPQVVAIHHQNVDMHPVDFAQRTVSALQGPF